jgi:hypothetical protein
MEATMTTRWKPQPGDLVWMNYPDHPDPIGRCVGYTQDFGYVEGDARYGQPVILGRKPLGPFDLEPGPLRLFLIAPAFLLPFPWRGPEWRRAEAEGRIGA